MYNNDKADKFTNKYIYLIVTDTQTQSSTKAQASFLFVSPILSTSVLEIINNYYQQTQNNAFYFLISSIVNDGNQFSGFKCDDGSWDGDDNGVIGYVCQAADPDDSLYFNNEIELYINNNWQLIRLV